MNEPQTRRRSDFRPRLQHGGADRGRERQNYPAEIALVAVEPAGRRRSWQRARAGIATEIVDHATFGKDRAAFERALQAVLEKHRIDLVCLAGFMRLLTPGFVGHWPERMLNIHPALLPAFKGLDTHKRALEAGAKVHGATVHFVVPEMDSGPIIAQGAVAVRDDDSERARRPRARGRTPHLSRWRSSWWRKAACASWTAAA